MKSFSAISSVLACDEETGVVPAPNDGTQSKSAAREQMGSNEALERAALEPARCRNNPRQHSGQGSCAAQKTKTGANQVKSGRMLKRGSVMLSVAKHLLLLIENKEKADPSLP
jgi:hypothetical protein